MTNIPLSKTDWKRLVADEAELTVKNRYFETNPLNTDQVALLSRPGLKKWMDVGPGPITAVYSQPGSFNDSLFVASGTNLYKVDTDETITLIGVDVFPQGEASSPEMVATSTLGTVPAFLFCTDGSILWVYVEDGFARNTLEVVGTIATGDVVRIDDVYYKFTSGSVDTGTPAGTLVSPWLVAMGVSNATAIQNLYNAIRDSGVSGTAYSTLLTAHATINANEYTSTTLAVHAIVRGSAGNLLVNTTTGTGVSWQHAATLTGGGTPSMTQIQTPDDVGIVSLAYTSSYVICVVKQGQDRNGRFYWINPGEVTIEALNFATAERSPDPVFSVRSVGDQFWLLGQNSTEIWYTSGAADVPFQRVQGRLFERGILAGTAIQVKDTVILVDSDGVVYSLSGSPQRISDNSVEERIRNATRDFVING